jgi:hypothetical protein
VTIGKLGAEMDMMDEISHGGTSTGNVPRNMHREWRSLLSVEMAGERASRTEKGALLDDNPGPSMSYPVFMPNQVLIVCMTQDQLFHTYGQKC